MAQDEYKSKSEMRRVEIQKSADDKERKEKYWICSNCAKEKKWKAPDWAVTCVRGLCGWCEREDEAVLIPVVDFSGPGKKAVWD